MEQQASILYKTVAIGQYDIFYRENGSSIVEGGHFALDEARQEIIRLMQNFLSLFQPA